MRILYRPGVRYHGVWMGNGGQVFQCFDPPWWHVWQWATWLWCTRVRKWPRGTVSIDNRGTSRTVRMWQVPAAPRPRVEDQFKPRG